MYEKEILELYRRCGIHSFPVDCDRILKAFGYDVMTYQEASGNDTEARRVLMTISTDGFAIRDPKRVYVNERSYVRRQLFTKAHEIGHIAMMSDSEDVANAFAANLLAPRPIIFAKKLKSADAISKAFGISVAAANNALIHYQYIPNQACLNLISYFGLRHLCPWPFNTPSIDEIPGTQDAYDLLFAPWQPEEPVQAQPVTCGTVHEGVSAPEKASGKAAQETDHIDQEPVHCVQEAEEVEAQAQRSIQDKLERKKEKQRIQARIRRWQRKCTAAYEKMVSVDPLSADAQAEYKKYQREMWDAERMVEYLTNTMPERDLEYARGISGYVL